MDAEILNCFDIINGELVWALHRGRCKKGTRAGYDHQGTKYVRIMGKQLSVAAVKRAIIDNTDVSEIGRNFASFVTTKMVLDAQGVPVWKSSRRAVTTSDKYVHETNVYHVTTLIKILTAYSGGYYAQK